jgi:flagellar basal-body rod modification protein FlgD
MSTSVSGLVQGQTAQQVPGTVANSNAFDNMDLQQFIKLLVTEMQNQDPTNPMDNSQILQQISQIKNIASNDKLSSTLTSLQLQQDMMSGSVLLNQTITGLTAAGDKVTGKVDKVSVANSKVQLHIGANTIDLKNISEIDTGA